jgi:hypothetical protein
MLTSEPIAGTDFVLLADVQPFWTRLVRRIALTESPLHVLDRAYDACHNQDALPLWCPDGLVIMTLRVDPDGTITADVLMAASFGVPGAFKRREEQMIRIAHDAGAKRLAFRTDRKGWKRLLGPEWRLDGEVFSRSV